MRHLLKGNKGFTLIELMLIVGIIGILSAVAVPTFMGYQSKTKQAEAKVNLSGIFSQETAYFVEKGWYGTSLPGIGFSMAGKPRYYDFTIETPSGTPPDLTWSPNAWSGASGTPGNGPPAGAQLNLDFLPGASAYSFTALAAGNIDTDSDYDTWTIGSSMAITNHWTDVND